MYDLSLRIIQLAIMLQENEMVEIGVDLMHCILCILSLSLRSHLFEGKNWHDPKFRWIYNK